MKHECLFSDGRTSTAAETSTRLFDHGIMAMTRPPASRPEDHVSRN